MGRMVIEPNARCPPAAHDQNMEVAADLVQQFDLNEEATQPEVMEMDAEEGPQIQIDLNIAASHSAMEVVAWRMHWLIMR